MRSRRRVTAVLAVLAVAGCGVTIAEVNERPDSYYQKPVNLTGQVTRRQILADAVLLEIADRRSHRILVRTTKGGEPDIGDWVRVEGILVPETQVGDVTVYDVVQADQLEKTSAPRLPDFR
jgi:uncharacterized membrane protein YcgQ (UPF0703/DUF1980 family)